MEVALTFQDRQGNIQPLIHLLPSSESKPASHEIIETYCELPLQFGEFQPVVIRGTTEDKRFYLNCTVRYSEDKPEDWNSVTLPPTVEMRNGAIVPAHSIVGTAPLWVEEGMKYARAVHAKLFAYPKEVLPGLGDMLLRHPKSFYALARATSVHERMHRTFVLAHLSAQWDWHKSLGNELSERERVADFAQATKRRLTASNYETVKKYMNRWRQKHKLNDVMVEKRWGQDVMVSAMTNPLGLLPKLGTI